MQATLSFNYPEDEGKLEDALKATEYREALERVAVSYTHLTLPTNREV